MELEPGIEQPRTRGRAGAALGILSAVLLYASFRWAHHWGARADAIVATWALSTLGALGVSLWALFTTDRARRFAKLGIWLAGASFFAATIVGLAAAAGLDTTGPCGGG